MDATDTSTEARARREDRGPEYHPDCFACAPRHPFGLKVAFAKVGDCRVEGTFPCGWFFQGYPGKLHGGIVSTLLDSAMVHALMNEGIEAVTADLQIRFKKPVEVGVPARILGERRGQRGPIHDMVAVLEQKGQVKATARARFLEIRQAPSVR